MGTLLFANASEVLNEIKLCHLKFVEYHPLQDSPGISVTQWFVKSSFIFTRKLQTVCGDSLL